MHILYNKRSIYATFAKIIYGKIAYGSDFISVPYSVRGKINLPSHGKEFLHLTVSTF